MSTHTVLCGDCEVEVELLREDDGSEHVRCPTCKRTATKEFALKDAGGYAKDKMADALRSTIKKAASRSKMLTYKPGTHRSSKHQWILDGI